MKQQILPKNEKKLQIAKPKFLLLDNFQKCHILVIWNFEMPVGNPEILK